MSKSDPAEAAPRLTPFTSTEAGPPPGVQRPATAAAAGVPQTFKARHYVDYAKQVWNRDRTLAARHLHEALRLEPDNARANNMMAGYFYLSGLVADALPYSAKAVEVARDDVDIATDHALVLDMLGRADEALAIIGGHLRAGRFTPELVLRFASLAEKLGGGDSGGGGGGGAIGEEALGLVRRALSVPTLTPLQRKSLRFYGAKLLDRMKRYDEAFEYARMMHRAAPVSFDPHLFRRQMADLAAWFTPQRLATLAKATHGWDQPVLVVGMPRSGTTLVEQILDSHPDVFGAGELLDFTRVVDQAARLNGGRAYRQLSCGQYTAWLAGATPAQLDALAGLYLSRVTSFAPRARYITDKLPFNWMHLGLISQVFPQARVIQVLRDPMDTCLSCYMTHFHDAVSFSTDLTHLGMQYVDHVNLMEHWRGVLELPILQVSYEALVTRPEEQVRRVLEFLGLPWDPACLSFHRNARVAPTASVDQVRRPLYGSSVGRWKNYAAHLRPLSEALGGMPSSPPPPPPREPAL